VTLTEAVALFGRTRATVSFSPGGAVDVSVKSLAWGCTSASAIRAADMLRARCLEESAEWGRVAGSGGDL
jgi:hypothetical protein